MKTKDRLAEYQCEKSTHGTKEISKTGGKKVVFIISSKFTLSDLTCFATIKRCYKSNF